MNGLCRYAELPQISSLAGTAGYALGEDDVVVVVGWTVVEVVVVDLPVVVVVGWTVVEVVTAGLLVVVVDG